MDFISSLPKTSSGYDSIWVIVDRLTKSAHFLPVKVTYPVFKYVELYLAQIVCLHGVPKTIVSNRGLQFTSQFWDELHKAMGTIERVNRILEDMLRACTLIYSSSWDTCLPFA